MKIAVALVVTGALSIGLAAYGSGSNATASSVHRGVRLDVINKDRAEITVEICQRNVRCKPKEKLGFGQSADMHAGEVDGWIRYADGYTVKFRAVNPTAALPYIDLSDAAGVEYGGKVWQTQFCELHPSDPFGLAPLFAGCLPTHEHVLAPHTFNLRQNQCLPQSAGYDAPKPLPPSYTFTAKRGWDTADYVQMTLTVFKRGGAERCP